MGNQRLRGVLDPDDEAERGKKLMWGSGRTRFIVVTRSRTGSNMLISLLNSHPEIEAKGELLARLKGSTHQQILEEKLVLAPITRVVGFKLFYYHPMDHGRDDVWRDFTADRDIRIIHLKRRNVLRTCVSRAIAEKQDAWAQRGGELGDRPVQSKAVTLPYDDLKAALEQTKQWEKNADAAFSSHPCLSAFYEDLADSRLSAFRKVAEFLSVADHTPKTRLRKQNVEPTSQLVVNYDELRERFRDTKWQNYFDE